jgi:hypothetical protein
MASLRFVKPCSLTDDAEFDAEAGGYKMAEHMRVVMIAALVVFLEGCISQSVIRNRAIEENVTIEDITDTILVTNILRARSGAASICRHPSYPRELSSHKRRDSDDCFWPSASWQRFRFRCTDHFSARSANL